MKKKIYSLVLSFAIVFTMLVPFTILSMNIDVEAVTYTADSTWYSADKSILEINDIPDFIAFMNKMNELGTTDNGNSLGHGGNLSAISWTGKMPFEGQTIILNTDIVLNPGVTFSASGPSNSSAFKFIRTKNVGFGGIFDGQGHTISGLYISPSDSKYGAAGSIFGVGGAATKQMNVVVRNLQIKNSFIENSAMGVASVFSSAAFNSHVLIENVYSEAILKSNQTTASTDGKLNKSIIGVNIGGFCATVGGDLTIVNSVYEGTFATKDTSTTPKKYIGGMVGNITNKKINNVTYAGSLTVESSAYYGKFEGSAVYMGKLSGDQTAGSTVTVNNSIFGGDVKPTNTATPNYIGRFVGLCTSNYTININKSVYTSMYYKGTETPIKANYNKENDNEPNAGSAVDIVVTTDNNIKGAKNSLHANIDLYWIANGTRGGYPVPASYITLFRAESLKHNYVNALPTTARDLFDQLGVKLENGGIYTEDSYRRYSDAYDDIVTLIFMDDADLSDINVPVLKTNAGSMLLTHAEQKRIDIKDALGAKIINANNYYTESSYIQYSNDYDSIIKILDEATTVEALGKIDVATPKANAEAKLVSVDSVKATLLAELGEKKVNNDEYTTASYAEYSSAYDAIVNQINNAGADVEDIDVSALKSAAEALLTVYVPEPETNAPETDEPETDEPETDAPETDAPEADAPEADITETESKSETETDKPPVKKGCGGCGSSAALSAIAIVTAVGAAFIAKRKEN